MPACPSRSTAGGRMEVDMLCEDSRVVVELDGVQHLGDAEAYRRDRRKDRLLQENGYRVLRFLAEDVARDLDTVLDAIVGSLRHSRGIALKAMISSSAAPTGRPSDA
ncbi:MAG: endonuclease domain-containing protein [Vicinamibacterales bacterium]